MMNPDGERELLLLQGLIEAFERLGVTVDFAKLSVGDVQGKGGLAKIGKKKIMIVDRDLPPRDKNEVLASELAKMDTEGIFLSPLVRDEIEKRRG